MSKPFVAIVMGSDSDLPVMEACFDVLRSFDIQFEARITSAHRTPEVTKGFVKDADQFQLQPCRNQQRSFIPELRFLQCQIRFDQSNLR